LTNIPAQVVNNATPADVGVVIVDGDVLMHDGNVKTMDADAVRDRVETAIDRFELETDWELGIGERAAEYVEHHPRPAEAWSRPVAWATRVPVGQR